MKMFSKEKTVVTQLLEHSQQVSACLEDTRACVHTWVMQSNPADTVRHSEAAHQHEDEADKLLRQIRGTLFAGAFLPAIRGDLYRLLSALDRVANAGESLCDLIITQRIKVPVAFRDEFVTLSQASCDCMSPLALAVEAYFHPQDQIEDVRRQISEVSALESKVDELENALNTRIFSSDLSLAKKLHLQSLVQGIVEISDRAEDAGDELENVVMESII